MHIWHMLCNFSLRDRVIKWLRSDIDEDVLDLTDDVATLVDDRLKIK